MDSTAVGPIIGLLAVILFILFAVYLLRSTLNILI